MSDTYEAEEKCVPSSAKDSITDANTAFITPLRGRHRPKASTLDEEAALEEARDTVDDSDIQLTHRYGQRHCDAEDDDTLSPLGVISASVRNQRVGRVGHERTSSLDMLLSTRMDRNIFENRFLKSEEKSSVADQTQQSLPDSMFNRASQLSRLLAQRPTREKLEQNNIIKSKVAYSNLSAAQSQLAASQKRDKLSSFIQNRPKQLDLTHRNILSTQGEESLIDRSRKTLTQVPDAS